MSVLFPRTMPGQFPGLGCPQDCLAATSSPHPLVRYRAEDEKTEPNSPASATPSIAMCGAEAVGGPKGAGAAPHWDHMQGQEGASRCRRHASCREHAGRGGNGMNMDSSSARTSASPSSTWAQSGGCSVQVGSQGPPLSPRAAPWHSVRPTEEPSLSCGKALLGHGGLLSLKITHRCVSLRV